jgi:hypothetical protein
MFDVDGDFRLTRIDGGRTAASLETVFSWNCGTQVSRSEFGQRLLQRSSYPILFVSSSFPYGW